MQPGGGHGRIPAISSPPPSSSALAPALINSGFEPIQQQAIIPRNFSHSQSAIRPMQPPQAVAQNAVSNLQALQAWAQQRNIDLSNPANLRLMNQIVPLMQSSSRSTSLPIQNEANTLAHQPAPSSTNVRSFNENGASARQMPPPSVEQFHARSTIGGTELPQSQQSRPLAKQQPHIVFTKQQQHALKAQILAFKRLKNGEGLPKEILSAIVAPPLDSYIQPIIASSNLTRQEISSPNHIEEQTRHVETSQQPSPLPPSTGQSLAITEPVPREEKSVKAIDLSKDNGIVPPKDQGGSMVKPSPKEIPTRKFHGPLFDFPCFSRRADSTGSVPTNYNLSLSYDLKDLLHEEGVNVLNTKRIESLKKITGILDKNRIKPDLMLRLQIEEKKLRLFGYWSNLRDELDKEQKEIMAMSDRQYRLFIRQCERDRVELSRQVHQVKKQFRDKQLKSLFQWRKKLLEAHWALRDARTTRNRGVAKYHERMLKESSKRKDGDRDKRMDALKNNDVDRYKEMLLEQQKTSVPGDAAQRFAVLTSFLSQTEDYLSKLGGKITASKTNQEVEEAANAAARTARAQGLSEEEVKAATACAREEAMIRNSFTEMNALNESSSTVNKYYNLAHAVNEKVHKQPSMLRAGILRDYQLVGLQWMLSLYNNNLNGILADEMGLGKTVQVMALIAYLMEFKGNNGPHLIIVPNAVLVNWKSELLNWLPSVKCLYYVGTKDQRNKLFSHEVIPMKFNILVTTYEFVMKDRPKLSRVNWQYTIIDEAQRMKDRESVLARDLDRYKCQRRLLLTGTPLQNDLKELWSLLNLLLPQVFDNGKTFHDWFSQPFQKDGASQNNVEEDDWLETEKKVIIIHRLHQILEPFMLRRRVEDVEGSIPPKVPIVLRCRMSAIQGAIYDWIKSTGTIRVDPEEEEKKLKKNPNYQPKMYKNVTNKCVELRKLCNHPLLNYPYFNDYSRDFVVRSCGKLWVLDRILLKLQRTGHRVLLFSTMTKLLDIVEEYLQWRRLVYRRIDGSTSLEERESAIVDFNSSDSDSFIFLLSIRAAGRGLNLQSADTVVIYDPDVNPQNEEQAVARAHRIGQTREVKVIYLESVVDKISSFEKEDELRNGGTELDSDDDDDDEFVGKDRYMGSIESLIRHNIQQYKIEMADEVINAGKFDQITTHEERRINLESLLHDEEKNQAIEHDVPSLQQINRMIARSDEEVELFDQMDEEFDWTMDMVKHNQVPQWLRAGSREVNAIVSNLSKKSSKNILVSNNVLNSNTSERRGRAKGSYGKRSVYVESSDEEDEGESDASSDDMEEYEDDDSNNKVLMEDDDDDEDEEFVNWNDENDDSEDQIKKPPQIKRKRTLRGRPKHTVGRVEHRSVRQKRSFKPINRDVQSPISMDMSESIQRKCKTVIAKFKRRIDKDGHQTVPILFDLWKKNKNTNFSSKSTMSTNLLDLHRIEEQLDSYEYNEVSEFVTDVQIMLESVVQYSSYSHEVAKEARKLQDIFFETLKSTFPNEEYPRRQIPVMDRTNRVGSSKSPLESSLSHPGELVFCRRKRKDREKQRVGVSPSSPMSSHSPLIGPSSSPGLHDVQWAKPVKRVRSDTGKRRHS